MLGGGSRVYRCMMTSPVERKICELPLSESCSLIYSVTISVIPRHSYLAIPHTYLTIPRSYHEKIRHHVSILVVSGVVSVYFALDLLRFLTQEPSPWLKYCLRLRWVLFYHSECFLLTSMIRKYVRLEYRHCTECLHSRTGSDWTIDCTTGVANISSKWN